MQFDQNKPVYVQGESLKAGLRAFVPVVKFWSAPTLNKENENDHNPDSEYL